MQLLSKTEAISFVRERASIFDASSNPFTKSAWLTHFIEQVVASNWTIVVPESSTAGSLMLLYSTPEAPGKLHSLTNYYASLFSPSIGQSCDDASMGRLVGELVEMTPACSTVNFAPLSSEAADTLALEKALSNQHWYVRRYFCHGNWYLPGIPFDEYMAGRDSKVRNTLERKSRKFGGELRIVTEVADVDAAMDVYDAVYAKSWKQPEPYPQFVRGWARICAQNGWLRLGIATIGDTPIAAQFWFTVDGRAYIFKLAYDEEHSKWSAGSLLTAKLMRHSLDVDKVVEVDYLTGDDAYKSSWMTLRRERIGLMACNTRTAAGLGRAVVELAGAMRQRLRGQNASRLTAE